ncbi:putative monocarboxylate transporter [Xylariomycetidae sp. FL2044]|nr:putative monocarboxylate transporter [Xylariomycetidae sp. FL2044]
MSRHENDSSRQPSAAAATQQQETLATSENGYNLDQVEAAEIRQRDSKRRRACVIIGSGLSQLPIWGFAMNYGVFQEYYFDNWMLQGNRDVTGIIGTTSNGVMYLSMPILFVLFSKRWARHRQTAALCGALIACASFVLSSFSTHFWHLVATQGVLAAMGCALMYSPCTLSLGEWFSTHNRALAYGVVLSCKNVVGSACPFLFRALLDRYGFRATLRIWTALVAGTSLVAIALVPPHPSSFSVAADARSSRAHNHHHRRAPAPLPWAFLRHRTFYVYAFAILAQSSGYGLPSTYLGTYARDVTRLSQTSATLLLALFNVPGIASSFFFGYLSDNRRLPLSATTTTAIAAGSSALSAFLFWGLTSPGSAALLTLFSLTFGFFAGGYSATWGGVLNELEGEAARHNEAVDPGMLYGLLNGARGLGYVGGGLVGVQLLKAAGGGGGANPPGSFGYGTSYGPVIIFTGLSAMFGGWGLLWKWKKLLRVL